jgi:hypothetical protein
MRRRITIALGVLAAISGLASSVHAEPTVGSNAETEGVTLSGESLVGLESRTVGDDFGQFFLGDASTTPINTTEGNNNFNTQDEDIVIREIDEDTDLVVNQPISPAFNSAPTRQNEPFNTNESVEVQFDLD